MTKSTKVRQCLCMHIHAHVHTHTNRPLHLQMSKGVTSEIPASFSDEDFCRQQPGEYHCGICNRLPSNPVRSECCNTVYCEPCSKILTHCPVHNDTQTFKNDSKLKATLQGYRVWCPFKCGWKGRMYLLKQHLPEHSK